jgi:hypothetical protein
MSKLGAFLFVLLFNSVAFADFVGFTFIQVGAACGLTWILPNNAPPDFFYPFNEPTGYPGYSNVSAASTCVSGSGGVFSNIVFPASGGIGFNDFAVDLFGPQLFAQSGTSISFLIGTFQLADEFNFQHFLIDIHVAPEPATLVLVIVGLVALGGLRMRRDAITKG